MSGEYFGTGPELPNTLSALARHIFGERRDLIGLWSGLRKPGVTKLLYPAEAYFQYPEQLDQAEQWAAKQAKLNREVYFCAHLLTAPKRTKDHASNVLALYADGDGADLSKSPVPPSAIVESSPGRTYPYLRLSRPIAPDKAESLNKRWALAMGADDSGFDLTQLLRVPGTPNHKYPEKPIVTITSIDNEVIYDPDDLDRLLPKLPSQTANRPADLEALSQDDAELVKLMLKNSPVTHRLWNGDTSDYNNASKADAGLIRDLLRATGFDCDRTERLMLQSKLRRDKWDDPRGEKSWLRYSIDRLAEDPRTWPTHQAKPSTNGNDNSHHPEQAEGCCTGCTCGCPEPGRLQSEVEQLRGLSQSNSQRLGNLRQFRQTSTFSGKRKDVVEAIGFEVERARQRGASEAVIFYGDREAKSRGQDPGGLASAAGTSPQTVEGTVDLLRGSASSPWDFRRFKDERGWRRVKVVFDPASSLEQDLAKLAALPKAETIRKEPIRCPDCVTAKLQVKKTCTSCGQVVAEYEEQPPAPKSLVQGLDKDRAAHPSPSSVVTSKMSAVSTRATLQKPATRPGIALAELPSMNDTNGHSAHADLGFDPSADGQPPPLFQDVMVLGGRHGFPPIVVNGRTFRGQKAWDKLRETPALLPRAYELAEQYARSRETRLL